MLNNLCGSGSVAAVPALGTLCPATETMNRPANLLPAERRVASGGNRSLPPSDQGLIREFIQALAEEISGKDLDALFNEWVYGE